MALPFDTEPETDADKSEEKREGKGEYLARMSDQKYGCLGGSGFYP
jgi:hypothetical protein